MSDTEKLFEIGDELNSPVTLAQIIADNTDCPLEAEELWAMRFVEVGDTVTIYGGTGVSIDFKRIK